MSVQTRTRRGWVVPAAVASAAVVASLAMGTLGAYTATINGENNLAGSGTLTMSETLLDDAGLPTADVYTTAGAEGNYIDSEINRYGGNLNMVPGDSVSTTVRIQNTGEVGGTLSLEVREAVSGTFSDDEFTAADPQPAENLADTLTVTLTGDSVGQVYSGSLAGFGGGDYLDVPLPANEAEDFTFAITFPEGAANPDLMGQHVRQGLTWTLTSTGAANEAPAA